MKRRIFAGILAALLLLPPLSARAEDTVLTGTQKDLTWTLDAHVLTFTGKGTVTGHPDKLDAQEVYEIVIGEGVTGAEAHALAGYPNMQKLTLPSTFTSLAPYALQHDAKLETIRGLEHVTDFNFQCLTGTAYIAAHPFVITDGKLYYAECTGTTDITVPDGVKEIMPFAFGNLTGSAYLPEEDSKDAVPVTVTLPDSVTDIRDSAFAFCAGVTCVKLPEGLQTIGDRAFFGCANLGSLSLGEQVSEVGEQAFFNCRKLETLTVRNPETTFGENAYGLCYDWKPAIASRMDDRADTSGYARMLHELEKRPCCMDEAMARFAVHFFGTTAYGDIRYENGFEAFLKAQGRIAAYRNTPAQTFAEAHSLRFEALDAVKGDVNLDGTVDILDVIALHKHLLGISELGGRSRASADCNGDNMLTLDDSLAVLRYILGIHAA